MGINRWRRSEDYDGMIQDGVHIGKNTKLEAGSKVYGKTWIGNNCIVGTNSVIKSDVVIGDYTIIGSMVLIEKDVVVENNCSIMPFVALGSGTRIGNNCFISPYFCHTNCRTIMPGEKGSHPNRLNAHIEPIIIEDDVVIGANCSTIPGVRIGKGSKISMNCFIKKDVPQYSYLKSNTVYD